MNNYLAPAPILIPLGVAFLLPLVALISRALRPLVCILGLAASLVVLVSLAKQVFGGEIIVYWMSSWTPRQGIAIGISLSIDAWGLLIALTVCVVALMTVIYAM